MMCRVRSLLTSLAAGCAALVLVSPALAGPVSLKAETLDSDGRVTLGDLFDGAGAASDLAVASRTGPAVVLDAQALQGLARRAGLSWDNPQGLRRIVVRAGAPAASVTRGHVEVLTYSRSLNAGEVLSPADLAWVRAAGAPSDAPDDADQVIGMVARRPLRAGTAASLRDVSAPEVIRAGDLVEVTWSDGYVTLTMQGRALRSAARGQSLPIQNSASKKVVEAIATGPAQAATGPQAQRLKAAGSSQLAAR
jgi:flagella basal body P-ring formation protein FlgA